VLVDSERLIDVLVLVVLDVVSVLLLD